MNLKSSTYLPSSSSWLRVGILGMAMIAGLLVIYAGAEQDWTETPIRDVTDSLKIWTDDDYISITGQTKQELLDSKQYFPTDWFLNATDLSETPLRIAASVDQARRIVKFILFAKTLRRGREVGLGDTNSLHQPGSGWTVDRQVKILIHGLDQTVNDHMPMRVKEAYMSLDDVPNIICVDWASLAAGVLQYLDNAQNTNPVGQIVAEFVNNLIRNRLTTADKVHIVGFSLGAHVAGVAGNRIQALASQKISRITGLDPAGPSFGTLTPLRLRLDPTDANFVDVLHTNMGDLNPFTGISLGTRLMCGHADFLPNGGERQPSCSDFGRRGNLVERIVTKGTCSHAKATEYFQRSIFEEEFRGCPCGSWRDFQAGRCQCGASAQALMGEFCRANARGVYYLRLPF